MPVLPSITTGKSSYRTVFLVFLIIAGLVGNYCRYPLFLETLRQDDVVVDYEVRLKNRDGALVECSISAKMQRASDGLPLKIIGTIIAITEALKLLHASLTTTISIQQDIDAQASIILADPTQVHHIVINLCTNAFHAMEEGGGTLAVSLGRISSDSDLFTESPLPPGEFVRLSVRDSGIGMDQGVREKIFDPYFTTKEVGKGTGLGLAMVQGIIRGYGGGIVCDSAPGQGTVFHVAFPVVEACRLPETGVVPGQATQVG